MTANIANQMKVETLNIGQQVEVAYVGPCTVMRLVSDGILSKHYHVRPNAGRKGLRVRICWNGLRGYWQQYESND